MNARSIALIATFVALAIALNTIRIPTLYWPNMTYTLCDIPVVIAFLICGFKIGILVEILHIVGQLVFFPVGSAGFIFYPMGLVTIPLMLSGIYLANKLAAREAHPESQTSEKRKTAYLTGLAAAFRGGLMPIIDYGVLYHVLMPLVLGVRIPDAVIATLVPSFVLYNVTSALYVVPIAYFTARRASKYLRT